MLRSHIASCPQYLIGPQISLAQWGKELHTHVNTRRWDWLENGKLNPSFGLLLIHACMPISHAKSFLSKAPLPQIHIYFHHHLKYRMLSLKSGSGMVETSQVRSLESKSSWSEDLWPKDTSYLHHSILSPINSTYNTGVGKELLP